MYNVLYDTFKKLADDPQEPIDLEPLPGLLRNEIEMISQTRYFSPQQVYMMLADAAYDIRILSLPNVGAMSLEELERAWRVRMVVYYVQDDPQIQRWIMNSLPPDIPNQRKLYDSIVFLNRELKFAQGCYDEIIKRIRSKPTTLATHGLVEMWREEMMQLDPQFAQEVRTRSFKYLRSELLRERIIPDKSERESLINEALGKRGAELAEMPYYKRISEFKNTVIAVRQDMKDWLKKQRRQKRFPEDGFVSLDAEVENEKGGSIPMLELLEDKYPAVELKFTDGKREQLDEAIGKKARRFLELSYLGYSDKEIVDMMGYKNQSPISKHRRKVKENYYLIKEIMLE